MTEESRLSVLEATVRKIEEEVQSLTLLVKSEDVGILRAIRSMEARFVAMQDRLNRFVEEDNKRRIEEAGSHAKNRLLFSAVQLIGTAVIVAVVNKMLK